MLASLRRLNQARAALVLLLVAAGCGDDSATRDDDTGTATDNTGTGDGDGEPTAQFLVNHALFTPDGSTTFLSLVDSLSAGTEVDTSESIELPGYVIVSAPPDRSGTFYIGLSDRPLLQRYEVGLDGTVAVTGEVSFAGLGLTSASSLIDPIHYVSPTKAYFVDNATLQVIVWNPQAMEIVGSFELDGLFEDTYVPVMYFLNEDAGRLVVSSGYQRPDMTFDPMGRVAIIDTANDSVVYGEQTRCGFLSWTTQDTDGNTYFISHSGQAITRAAGVSGDPTFEPCMVRLESGATDFDDSYYVDLTTLTGRPAGALVPGAGDTAYTLVYQEDAPPITPDNYNDAFGAPFWEYYSFTLGDEENTIAKVPDVPAGAPYAVGFEVDVGTATAPLPTPFATSVSADFSSTVVYDITDPTVWTPEISAPGFVYSIKRIR